MKIKLFTTALLIMMLGASINGQRIYLDQSITVDGVTLFPAVDDPNQYYYAPSNPRVSTNDDGNPSFSFVIITKKKRSEIDDEDLEQKDIEVGIVTALVEYGLSKEELAELNSALKKEYPQAKPIKKAAYQSGVFRLISSTVKTGSVVISSTKAPLLEGSKAAISMRLDPKSALYLWATFKSNIPDISFVFEMDIAGFSSPIKGSISCDLNRVYEGHKASLGVKGSIPGVVSLGANIEASFEQLRQNNVIKIKLEDDDDQMDKLIMAAYHSLKNEIFERVDDGYAAPSKEVRQEVSPFDRINQLDVAKEVNKVTNNDSKPDSKPAEEEETKNKESNGRNETASGTRKSRSKNALTSANKPNAKPPTSPKKSSTPKPSSPKKSKANAITPFSVFAEYRFRKKSMKKLFFMSFEKKRSMILPHSFAGNIGNMKNCKSCLTVIDLDEMSEFKQREVKFILEGDLLNYFGQAVNYVSINLRKQHKSGNIEYESSRIDYNTFLKRPHFSKLVYGWEEDNLNSWYEYDYRITWSYPGNCTMEGTWQKSSESILMVPSAVTSRELSISIDERLFEEHDVNNIFVSIKHNNPCGTTRNYIEATDTGQRIKTQAVRLKVGEPEKLIRLFSINGQIEYTITATKSNGEKISLKDISHNIDESPIIEINKL